MDLSIIQGPISVAPCQTLVYHDSQLLHRRTAGCVRRGAQLRAQPHHFLRRLVCESMRPYRRNQLSKYRAGRVGTCSAPRPTRRRRAASPTPAVSSIRV
jgi:hypothetical protein